MTSHDAAMTVLRAESGDITTYDVDAIVNAANSSLLGGGGVDGGIRRAGGQVILDECRAIVDRIGSLAAGDAVVTSAGAMPTRWVIHAVGPVWGHGEPAEDDRTLASAYTKSLALADAHRCVSVAFPNISTGVFGFPKERAAAVAIAAVRSYCAANPTGIEEIIFVCFDDENLRLYQHALG